MANFFFKVESLGQISIQKEVPIFFEIPTLIYWWSIKSPCRLTLYLFGVFVKGDQGSDGLPGLPGIDGLPGSRGPTGPQVCVYATG